MVSGAWYENAVNTAAETGIVSGVSEDTFGIGKNITRQEAAAILLRAAEKFGGFAKQSSEINFTDYEEISDYAKEAVSALNAAGVISGYPDGSFRPNDIMTRAQCSVMLGSVIEKGESNA